MCQFKNLLIILVFFCLAVPACTSATSGQYTYKPADHPLSFSSHQSASDAALPPPPNIKTVEHRMASAPMPTFSPSPVVKSAISPPNTAEETPARVVVEVTGSKPYMNPLTIFPKTSEDIPGHAQPRSTVRTSLTEGAATSLNPLTVFPQPPLSGETSTAQEFSRDNAVARAENLQSLRPGSTSPEVALEQLATVYSSLVQWVASQSDNKRTQATISDPELGPKVIAQLDGDYFSAAGLNCRRVRLKLIATAPPIESVSVCREQSGEWALSPRVGKNRFDVNP